MFGLFGKKKKLLHNDDRVYMQRQTADTALLREAKSYAHDGATVIICSFFRDSINRMEKHLQASNQPYALLHERPYPSPGGRPTILLLEAQQLASSHLQQWLKDQHRQFHFWFVEHTPYLPDELQLFETLEQLSQETPQALCFYAGLDDRLFRLFGGERVVELMKRLGMKDDEMVSHAMVSKSIRSAQEKLQKKVPVAVPAASEEEWFVKNYQ